MELSMLKSINSLVQKPDQWSHKKRKLKIHSTKRPINKKETKVFKIAAAAVVYV